MLVMTSELYNLFAFSSSVGDGGFPALGTWGWLNTGHTTLDREEGQKLINHTYSLPGGWGYCVTQGHIVALANRMKNKGGENQSL